MALGVAVGARGADHNRSGAYEVDFSNKVDRRSATLDSVRHAIDTEERAALMDSLILCKFLRGVFTDFNAEAAGMLRAVTGWDVTAEELQETARRIVAAKRQVNLLAGWTPEEDTLPERFLDAPYEAIPLPRFRARDFRSSLPSTTGNADGSGVNSRVAVRSGRPGGGALPRARRGARPTRSSARVCRSVAAPSSRSPAALNSQTRISAFLGARS